MFEEDPNYQGQNIAQMKNTRFKPSQLKLLTLHVFDKY